MPTNESELSQHGRDTNPDPITGEPGAHPVGTGVGAVAGGATGAAIGSIAGPIGTAVGTVIGAVAGGLAGSGVAEAVDPSAEDAYWRAHHRDQPYASGETPFDAFAPAYHAGFTGYREGQTFEEREADLRMQYEGGGSSAPAASSLAGRESTQSGTMQNSMSTYPLRWDDAREAARAAYDRVRRGEARRMASGDSRSAIAD